MKKDMSIRAWQGKVDTETSLKGPFSGVLCLCLCALVLSFSASLIAQVPEQTGLQISEPGQNLPEQPEEPEEAVELIVTLPGSLQIAMALSTPGLREQALLDLAVAANTLSRAKAGAEVEVEVELDHAALAQDFVDDRAWLQTLVDRYGWKPPHSSVLDPAAWLVLQELQQHDLENTATVFPGQIPRAVLIYQVFQRATESLAVANLPILLFDIEADAISLWDEFLQLTGTGEAHDVAWKVVETTWFADRQLPQPSGLDEGVQSQEALIENIPQALSKLVLSAVDAGPGRGHSHRRRTVTDPRRRKRSPLSTKRPAGSGSHAGSPPGRSTPSAAIRRRGTANDRGTLPLRRTGCRGKGDLRSTPRACRDPSRLHRGVIFLRQARLRSSSQSPSTRSLPRSTTAW